MRDIDRMIDWCKANPGRLFTGADMIRELDLPQYSIAGQLHSLRKTGWVELVSKQPLNNAFVWRATP